MYPELSLWCHCTLRASYAPTDGQTGPEGFFSSLNPRLNLPTPPFVLCISALAGVSWHHEELMSPGPRVQASARGQAELSGSWGRPLRAKQATRTGPGHTPGCTAGCPRQSEPCVSPSTFCSLRPGKSRGIWTPFLEAKLCYLISGTVPGEVTRESGLCLTAAGPVGRRCCWVPGAQPCPAPFPLQELSEPKGPVPMPWCPAE